MSTTLASNISTGLPSGMSGRPDARYATDEYYGMTNPFHEVEGGYKSKNRTLGLGSNRQKALTKAESIILARATLREWEKIQAEISNNIGNEYNIDKPIFQVVSARKVNNINELCDRYYAIKQQKTGIGNFSTTSLSQLDIYLDDIKDFWQGYPLEYLDTGNIQAHIDRYFELGKINITPPTKEGNKQHGNGRAAEALRSCYINLLKVAKKKRLIDYKYNPADETDLDDIDTKVKRSRCSEAVFKSVFDLTDKNTTRHYALAFEIAVVSKLRLTDLLLIRQERGSDWHERVKSFSENRNYGKISQVTFQDRIKYAPYSYLDKLNNQLVIFQQKTGKIFTIPFNHKVSESLPSIGEIITKINSCCNASSEFLLHHPKSKGLAREGAAIHPYSLSRKFKEGIRKLDLNWDNKKPPSMGELRSLGARLLKVRKDNEAINESGPSLRQDPIIFRDRASSTIEEVIEKAVSANEGVTESLGQTDRNIKLRYLDPRNLIFDDFFGFP